MLNHMQHDCIVRAKLTGGIQYLAQLDSHRLQHDRSTRWLNKIRGFTGTPGPFLPEQLLRRRRHAFAGAFAPHANRYGRRDGGSVGGGSIFEPLRAKADAACRLNTAGATYAAFLTNSRRDSLVTVDFSVVLDMLETPIAVNLREPYDIIASSASSI
jgi:hypothetical protein